VRTAGAARLYIPSGNSLTLKGVVLDTDLSLQGSTLNIGNGISLSGRQVFGNGTVTFISGGTQRAEMGTLGFYDATTNLIQNNGSTLTLAPDLLIRGEYLTIKGTGAMSTRERFVPWRHLAHSTSLT
jgi:hypothetical protein